MSTKYLDQAGLTHLAQKINERFHQVGFFDYTAVNSSATTITQVLQDFSQNDWYGFTEDSYLYVAFTDSTHESRKTVWRVHLNYHNGDADTIASCCSAVAVEKDMANTYATITNLNALTQRVDALSTGSDATSLTNDDIDSVWATYVEI